MPSFNEPEVRSWGFTWRLFYFMELINFYPFFYKGNRTNIMASRCGKICRIQVDWLNSKFGKHKRKFGEVDYENLIPSGSGYYRIKVQIQNVGGKSFTIHQIIASVFLNHNIDGSKLVVDHIDSNIKNNSVDNLRVITIRENCSKEKTLKRKYPVGVYYIEKRNCFVSFIRIKDKKVYLGSFKDSVLASQAYQNALKNL